MADPRITPAEKSVLTLLCDGKSVSEIADIRGVSYWTVKTQKDSLMSRFHVYKDTALVAAALRKGVID